MTELSPSGRRVLERAVNADAGFLFTNSGGLGGAPGMQVRKSLLNAGLIEVVPHEGKGDFFDGKALRATEAGFAAVGAEKPAAQGAEAAAAPAIATKAPTPRQNSKQAQLVEMLQRPSGASIAQICDAFGWQAHTTRAAISTLPKKAGVPKPTSTVDDGERIYRLPAAS